MNKKCFSVFNPAARKRGAIGIFDSTFFKFFATDEADALRQFQTEFETSGPPSVIRERQSPFDSECLFSYVQNTEATCRTIRHHAESLRRLMDKAARELAAANRSWHDDTDASDHLLYQAPADEQFPREMRDAAVLELVKHHLEIITENEAAQAAREKEAASAKS